MIESHDKTGDSTVTFDDQKPSDDWISDDPEIIPDTSLFGQTTKNLFAGLRLSLLLPVRLTNFQPSLASSILLLLIGIALLTAFSIPSEDGDVYFNDMGAGFLAAAILGIALLALVVTRSQGSLEHLPGILTLLGAAFVWIVIVLSSLGLLVDPAEDNRALWALALLWSVVVIARCMRVTFAQLGRFALLGIVLVTAGFAFGASLRGHTAVLLYAYDAVDFGEYGEYEELPTLDPEEVFLSQPSLLAQKLQGIDEGRPNETEMYFIGFAGNGDETVFASEVTFAEERVAEIFRTEGRSLVLASDFDNVDEEPIANTHNLFSSIASMGSKMDLEDDVLFLFLTSHGWHDATVDVSLYPLQLKALRADDLKVALDDAGIQWRVIVVSACYSGTFIEPLKTDRSMVLTASAADKTSFGCAIDRELTYFGEAFFKDAFGAGLSESFDEAKASIGEREEREGLSASDPQMFVGAEMQQKMAEFAGR